VIWIPGRLLLEAARSPATMHVLLDGPLRMGIFPAKMSFDSQARQWAAVWLAAGHHERSAVTALLRARAALQAATLRMLQARAVESRDSQDDHEAGLKVNGYYPHWSVRTSCAIDGPRDIFRCAGGYTPDLQSISRPDKC